MVLMVGSMQLPITKLPSLAGWKAQQQQQQRSAHAHFGSGFLGGYSAQGRRTQHSLTACAALTVLSPASRAGSSTNGATAVQLQPGASSPAFRPIGDELGWPVDFEAYYAMGQFIGAGSYGVCHQATHLETGRQVAIKVLNKVRPSGTRSRTLRRLKREAALLERLNGCGNVVQLVDKFETPDSVYFVLELCRGADLQEMLLERGSLDEATAARVVFECLRVLKACHVAGVVHNDVKPGNFMVDAALLDGPCALGWHGECASDVPVLKLLDFGCSQRLRSDGAPLSKRTGTPVYMAPEVYFKQYTELADVWSLGMMMHQCLTGRFPFWGSIKECLASSIADVMNAILYADLDIAAAGVDARFSPECADLLRRMLVRDPAQRITVDEALAHPWFARFARCECDGHDDHVDGEGSGTASARSASSTSNIVPFPRAGSASPPSSPKAGDAAALASDESESAVAVWAMMQSAPRFPMGM